MNIETLIQTLDKTFAYNIEKLGNRDGYIVQIWDGYGLRRANAWEIVLEEAIKKAFNQYQEDKEITAGVNYE